MPNPIRSSRRVVMLGVVISLVILGFTLPRPVSTKAQEPARPTDKKALREQIMTLHAEIDLMEIEQGVDRQAIADLMREERAILAEIESYVSQRIKDSSEKIMRLTMAGSPEQKWLDQWESWDGNLLFVAKELDLDEADFKKLSEMTPDETKKAEEDIVEAFGSKIPKDLLEQLKALFRIRNKEDYSKARARFAERAKEHVTKKGTEGVREKSESLKKEFARRSAELAGKKLDLDTLERQYREAQ